MARYRKRPVVIEAWQLGSLEPLPSWLSEAITDGRVSAFHNHLGIPAGMIIETLEGELSANSEAWIIRGIKGELYPCDDEIFRATYDLVTEEDRGEISGPKDGLSVGLDPLLTRE